jgi:hypothetical protein
VQTIGLDQTGIAYQVDQQQVENLHKVDKKARIRVAFDRKSFHYWRLQIDLLVKQDLLKSFFRYFHFLEFFS